MKSKGIYKGNLCCKNWRQQEFEDRVWRPSEADF